MGKQQMIDGLSDVYHALEEIEELGVDEINAMTLGRLRMELLKRDTVVIDTSYSLERLILNHGNG